MKRLWQFPLRLVWVLPLAFLAGMLLPVQLFLPLILVGLLVSAFAMASISEQKGYWGAHMEIAAIMQRAMEAPDRSDTDRLHELVNGIIFTAAMKQANARLPWWRRLRRRPSRSSR